VKAATCGRTPGFGGPNPDRCPRRTCVCWPVDAEGAQGVRLLGDGPARRGQVSGAGVSGRCSSSPGHSRARRRAASSSRSASSCRHHLSRMGPRRPSRRPWRISSRSPSLSMGELLSGGRPRGSDRRVATPPRLWAETGRRVVPNDRCGRPHGRERESDLVLHGNE
jgi:hypothetical protein